MQEEEWSVLEVRHGRSIIIHDKHNKSPPTAVSSPRSFVFATSRVNTIFVHLVMSYFMSWQQVTVNRYCITPGVQFVPGIRYAIDKVIIPFRPCVWWETPPNCNRLGWPPAL